MDKEWKKHSYEMDRSCDALVLAYSPEQVLGRDFGRDLYIPSGGDVEEAFGEALRKFFGEKEGSYHWADSVRWNTIANQNKIEERIREGIWEVVSGDSDYQTIFNGYLSSSGIFNHAWFSGIDDLYCFKKDKRELALGEFEIYWNVCEKEQWAQIHEFMRDYTKEQFKHKGRTDA